MDRSNHLGQLERELGIRSDEMKNLKRSYETVSKTLEQTVTSQSRLREALGQSKEREREGGLLSEERLAQLQSAESQLFETQVLFLELLITEIIFLIRDNLNLQEALTTKQPPRMRRLKTKCLPCLNRLPSSNWN